MHEQACNPNRLIQAILAPPAIVRLWRFVLTDSAQENDRNKSTGLGQGQGNTKSNHRDETESSRRPTQMEKQVNTQCAGVSPP